MKKTILRLFMPFLVIMMFYSCKEENESPSTKENESQILYGGGVTDVDSNFYKTVIIGSQEWMAENLKVTRFNDNSVIENIVIDSTWINTNEPAYCWHENNQQFSIENNYGSLYNFYAIETKKLCPVGWHTPNQMEWMELFEFVDENYACVNELRSKNGWNDDESAEDIFGLALVPGGWKNPNQGGFFKYSGYHGYYWSDFEWDVNHGYYNEFSRGDNVWFEWIDKNFGLSVRCIKD
jgi:uncharacterized protein (TIGR02145 family)